MTGNGYARVALTNNTTNWPAGNPKSNGVAIVFPTATPADWSRAYAWQILDASSGGNRMYWGPLASNIRTAVVNDTTADTFYLPAHGLTTDTIVRVFTHSQNALPAPLAEDTRYWVLASGLTTDAFKLSTSSGGTAVNLTALGFVEVGVDASIVVSAGGVASLGIGQLVITED